MWKWREETLEPKVPSRALPKGGDLLCCLDAPPGDDGCEEGENGGFSFFLLDGGFPFCIKYDTISPKYTTIKEKP